MIRRMIALLVFMITLNTYIEALYTKPTGCPQEIWDEAQPYFLPSNHPAKASLDKIFGNDRPLASEKAMKKAGFFKYKQSDKDIIVTGHPRLKGHIIKTYLDTSTNPDWIKWIQRIQGAQTIKDCVDYYGFNSKIKVPRKWIYPLPSEIEVHPQPGIYPKYFVLVAQDMGLISADANAYKWRHSMTPDYLDSLFVLLTEHRLVDSVYIDNIPFSYDGKIAFVDTEHVDIPPHHYPLKLGLLLDNLSSKMQNYWKSLINTLPKMLPALNEEEYSEEEIADEQANVVSKAPYPRHPNCPEEGWQAVQPYLLPPEHPARVLLDNIFHDTRVLASEKSMKKAGFTNAFERKSTGVVVAKHPRLRGYVVKAYLDSNDKACEWERWSARAKNAEIVKECLNVHGYNSILKVPKKWIYPLPLSSVSSPQKESAPKYFILIEQDMGVLSNQGNIHQWKHSMTKPLLEGLYTVIKEHCMVDSIRISNIPFCFDGRVAFIDTEWVDMGELYGTPRFHKLYDFLSSEMENYLKQLVNGS